LCVSAIEKSDAALAKARLLEISATVEQLMTIVVTQLKII
jgi:hypothetical protein